MYRQRFGLHSHVFPQAACGKTFTETDRFAKLQTRFERLSADPGLGVLTAEAGLGKTTAMRHLCAQLPRPDYEVVYVCDTATSPLAFYRQLAQDLGLDAHHRRDQLWRDIKETILHLVDDKGTRPVIVCDEAQHLSDRFLSDLAGFLNFTFDSRNPLVFWLVGQPALRARLGMQVHAALDSRVAARVTLEPITTREEFSDYLETGLQAAGATSKIVAEPARELLFRASRGVPRRVAYLLREALYLCHEREQNFLDEATLEAVLDEIAELPDAHSLRYFWYG
jgi:type II secretory pathway predicted ATPase ExeA